MQLTLSQPTFSGSFSSGHSLFTQISMNSSSQCTPNAFSNEALCLEVLGILKRCFMQQAEVRIQLYTGKLEPNHKLNKKFQTFFDRTL